MEQIEKYIKRRSSGIRRGTFAIRYNIRIRSNNVENKTVENKNVEYKNVENKNVESKMPKN